MDPFNFGGIVTRVRKDIDLYVTVNKLGYSLGVQ